MRFSSSALLSLAYLAQAAVLPKDAQSTSLEARDAAGLKSMTFYVDWAIYARAYNPQDLIAEHFTHVFYAFLDINPSGTVVLADTYADIDKHFPGDSWTEPGNNVFGCAKQLYLMKQKNRYMNTMLSIGGWTYRGKFAGPASTDAGRKAFASSAVQLLQDLGFDGIDVDWEYPASDAEAGDFVLLLKEIRTELDNYAAKVNDGKRYLLTVDSSAGPEHYNLYHWKDMDQYLDSWNLMAFDYAGGTFSNYSGYLANVYQDSNLNATPFSTASAINDYIAAGISPEKIVLGMPLYGRSFADTDGMGQPFNGVGSGTWQDGVWDYKDMPQAGATVYNNLDVVGSYSYDNSTKYLINYDTPEVQAVKADYITSTGLGGGWWWESSSDKTGAGSLVSTVLDKWGGTGVLERRQNQLNYPFSKYDNIKNQMGNAPSSSSAVSTAKSTPPPASSVAQSATSVQPATSTTTQPASTGGTVPQWGQCGGIGYTGATQCAPPYTCVSQGAYWSSCQ